MEAIQSKIKKFSWNVMDTQGAKGKGRELVNTIESMLKEESRDHVQAIGKLDNRKSETMAKSFSQEEMKRH